MEKISPFDSVFNNKTNDELFEWCESIAKTISDGHITIFRFTTNFKGFFGTPNDDLRDTLYISPSFSNIRELLICMISNPDKFKI